MTSTVTLHEGDNREHLRRLIDQGVRVHSVVTDPPYGLTSIVKRFGKDGAAPAKFGTDGAFSRASGGFMGKAWDASGIERDPEFWRLIWEILLPGGFVFAFSGSRTGHWQACAMETAGFIMHPMHGWVYGSGFPKAHNAAMAIDKALGVEQGFVPEGDPVKRMIPGAEQHATGDWTKTDERQYQPGRRVPSSPEAAAWEGWAYGTQSQKPALEPIYLGQKPFSEKTGAANLLTHGVGAVNIDACRVPIDPTADASQLRTMNRGQRAEDQNEQEWGLSKNSGDTPTVVRPEGRWPANLLHDGSAEVVALFPDTGKSGVAVQRNGGGQKIGGGESGIYNGSEGLTRADAGFDDSGSAARFFNSFPEGPDADAIIYQPKATKKDRAGSVHPTVKPVALMQHLIRHITPPGGVVLDPFAGSGTTAEAARREGFDCILMEQDPDYAAFLRQRFDLPSNDMDDDLLALPDAQPTLAPEVAAAFANDPELVLLLG